MCITPYYASLLDPEDPTQPLRKTVVPVTKEYARASCESDDPLGEEGASPVPRIVHRYPDRVLFLVTDRCATHCRYCTRSRMVGRNDGRVSNGHGWDQAIAYIESNRSVRDVLISGGDPLTLPDETLGRLLSRLRSYSARGDHPYRYEGARRSAPADHARTDPDAETLPSPLDQHPFHSSRRDHSRGGPRMRPTRGCGHSARQPDGIAFRDQ